MLEAKAFPLLWTTGLMAPEAYTLKSAIDGWVLNETAEQIRERAAQVYNRFQKCGIRAARNLFVSGNIHPNKEIIKFLGQEKE